MFDFKLVSLTSDVRPEHVLLELSLLGRLARHLGLTGPGQGGDLGQLREVGRGDA